MQDLHLYTDEVWVDFDQLRLMIDGQARDVMDEISEAGLEDEFMSWLEEVYGTNNNVVTLDEIWDYIRFDWQDIYRNIGLEG